ncbi:hypothetical protein [Brucella anthropi]|uniref:hypothetical protein n=1 Tax=Brucella anthropi TaxID=529 RepID=UPI0038502A18
MQQSDLKNGTLPALLKRLRPNAEMLANSSHPSPSKTILFFSFTDTQRRAEVITSTGDDFDAAWSDGATRVCHAAELKNITVRWLRVDWVVDVEALTWSELRERLRKTKRNYFRHGLALDKEFRHSFLETELNANAMLYPGGNTAHGIVNENNFRRFARLKFNLQDVNLSDDNSVHIFSTKGVFASTDELGIHSITGENRHAGRRDLETLKPDDVLKLINDGSSYLATQVDKSGRFTYGWHPCFDRSIPGYNSLRHASTVYSMLEAWEVTQEKKLLEAIDRAVGYLTETLIKTAQTPSGEAAFLVDTGSEVKLGGNAVSILALVKYTELLGTDRYCALLHKLAVGIVHMQDRDTGQFEHVLVYPSLATKEQFRIIYYDGEATFALMRLYALTRDEIWLETVERAFGYFIKAGHARAHDHWLSYSVNELTLYRPLETYYAFGIENFAGYLEFVLNRITTFPTLLELMMAARQMVERLTDDPQHRHLLEKVDLEKFYQALHARAHYLLNGHFWPELAMFYEKPAKISGSFFIRHHSFRVRIDDVEHYLSGFVAYLKYLRTRQDNATDPSNQLQ